MAAPPGPATGRCLWGLCLPRPLHDGGCIRYPALLARHAPRGSVRHGGREGAWRGRGGRPGPVGPRLGLPRLARGRLREPLPRGARVCQGPSLVEAHHPAHEAEGRQAYAQE
eukprot:1502834-Pyramimonas_sp.AAC.1